MSWLERGINKLREEVSPSLQASVHPSSIQHDSPEAPIDRPTPVNKTIFQAFEWHTKSSPPPPNETHCHDSQWGRLARILPGLAELGVTSIWLPPGCKANSPQGNGYDCYDLWDLGEFDQKWTRSTKWGSREELQDLVQIARRSGAAGVDIVWDTVLNHKTAGDATDETWAVEVDKEDRRVEISAPRKIEAWLKYDFPGREREGMKHSPLKWKAEHFNGTDWDQRAQRNAIYKLIDDPTTHPKPNHEQMPMSSTRPRQSSNRLARFADAVSNAISDRPVPSKRPGKGWCEDVDDMHGNYDYLIFSNVYYLHPDVRHDVLQWGEWMIHNTGIQGFRLDAAQHFSWNFCREWIARVQDASRRVHGKDVFVVGEVWSGEVSRQLRWLDWVTPPGSAVHAHAFDAPLLYSFSRISEDVRRGSKNADLRTLLNGPGNRDHQALVAVRPHQAITVVTNHDTQPGQSSAVPMDGRIKALFYAFILLRREGHPCVFWGDLYGTLGPKSEGPACQAPIMSTSAQVRATAGLASRTTRCLLPSLMLTRKLFAYGPQVDYFASMSCIGWTRAGTHDRPGCVVIMSIGPPYKWTIKKMAAGRPGEKWVDVLSERKGRPEVVVDEKGCGIFACRGRSVSVYVHERCGEMEKFPVEWNHDVYRQ